MRRELSCPFCRKAWHKTEEERDQRLMKRIEANDPVAMRFVGGEQYKGDYQSAINYYSKAADLGDAEAHYNLALMYQEGKGVEKDEAKYIRHMEEAAIGGHPYARYSLGAYELKNNNNAERAAKHLMIAAKQGEDNSMKLLMEGFRLGHVSKEDLDATFRAHHVAINAAKSPQRKAAEDRRFRMDRRPSIVKVKMSHNYNGFSSLQSLSWILFPSFCTSSTLLELSTHVFATFLRMMA